LSFYRNYTIKPNIDGGCPLLNTAIDADDNIPFLKEKANAALEEMIESLRYIIQKGIDKGEFIADLQAEKQAEIFFAMLEGAIMMSKLSDNPKTLNRILDALRLQVEGWIAT